MRRIRQWALAAIVAIALALSFSSVASADPGDSGFRPTRGALTISADPGDGGFSY